MLHSVRATEIPLPPPVVPGFAENMFRMLSGGKAAVAGPSPLSHSFSQNSSPSIFFNPFLQSDSLFSFLAYILKKQNKTQNKNKTKHYEIRNRLNDQQLEND